MDKGKPRDEPPSCRWREGTLCARAGVGSWPWQRGPLRGLGRAGRSMKEVGRVLPRRHPLYCRLQPPAACQLTLRRQPASSHGRPDNLGRGTTHRLGN